MTLLGEMKGSGTHGGKVDSDDEQRRHLFSSANQQTWDEKALNFGKCKALPLHGAWRMAHSAWRVARGAWRLPLFPPKELCIRERKACIRSASLLPVYTVVIINSWIIRAGVAHHQSSTSRRIQPIMPFPSPSNRLTCMTSSSPRFALLHSRAR